MKRKTIKTIVYIMTIIITSSCEKVIDFPLNDAPPQPVAEAVVNSMNRTASLKLSWTNNYYDTTGFKAITGAEAIIYNEAGDTVHLYEMSPGYYFGTNISVKENKEYFFDLKSLGTHYQAASFMPETVPVDSVYYEYNEASLFAPEGYRVWVSFSDPAGEENYFRINLYVNDTLKTNGIFYLWKDSNADGEKVNFILYRHSLKNGDTFRVELWAIDKQTYDYYFELQNTSSVNQNASLAAPANPENNITGGEIYGYFTAAAVSTSKKVVVRNDN
jgi:hypothetical protein